MGNPPSISRVRFWRASLQGWWLIVSIVLLAWGVFGSIRSEFITASDQERWRLPILFPHIPWHWLVIVFLVITLIAILEGSFREYQKHIILMSVESNQVRQLLAAERAKNAEPKLAGRIDCLEVNQEWDTERFGIDEENKCLLKVSLTLRVTLRNESASPTTVQGFRLNVLWTNGCDRAVELPVEDYSVRYSVPRPDDWGFETKFRKLVAFRQDVEITNTNHQSGDLRFLARRIPTESTDQAKLSEQATVREDVSFELKALDRTGQEHKIYEGTWHGLPQCGSIERTGVFLFA